MDMKLTPVFIYTHNTAGDIYVSISNPVISWYTPGIGSRTPVHTADAQVRYIKWCSVCM